MPTPSIAKGGGGGEGVHIFLSNQTSCSKDKNLFNLYFTTSLFL